MVPELLIYGLIFIFGLVFGSFFNVVGYRLPIKQSIAFPASHCPNCNHKLRFYENIPLISYLFLKGKCSSCKKKISFIYPLFELITAILFTISYHVFGFSFEFLTALIICSVYIILSISDIRYYIIPDEVLIVGLILLIIANVVNYLINDLNFFSSIIMPLLNGLGAFAVIYLFKILGDFLFNKESLGGGDIKLLFFIGFTIGFDMAIVTIFFASFIALPFSIVTLIKKNTNVLPFGPYLALSALIILFSGLNLDKIFNFFVS